VSLGVIGSLIVVAVVARNDRNACNAVVAYNARNARIAVQCSRLWWRAMTQRRQCLSSVVRHLSSVTGSSLRALMQRRRSLPGEAIRSRSERAKWTRQQYQSHHTNSGSGVSPGMGRHAVRRPGLWKRRFQGFGLDH